MEIVVTATHAASSVAAVTVAVPISQLDTTSLGHRVVLAAVVIGVKELLEPLKELEIVLKASLNQFINWYDLCSCCFRAR